MATVDPTIIPTTTSADTEWINWYDSLKSYFGKKVAKDLWNAAWVKRGSDEANTTNLRTYMSKEGITVDSGVLAHIVDWSEGIGDYFGDFFKLGKYAAYGVVAILILALLGITLSIIKDPKGSAETAGKLALL